MSDFAQELDRRLAAIREQGLYRELRRVDSAQGPRVDLGGRTLLNFSSNDYLGLANEPSLKDAAIRAVERYGAGAGASRLICGSLAVHHELDEALADFKGTEAALSFSTGYATALGTIGALLGKDDILVIDKLVHACVVDAARLCGAKLRVFAHNDLNELAEILEWASSVQRSKFKVQSSARRPRTLVVTESVFSMDGDQAPLREIVELKDKHGAWLMVDEAHATGLFGAKRRGLAEELGVADRIEIQMGTLGKALGAAGGYICGPRALIELLVNRARSFIFSTAPAPAAAAAATAGVRFVQSAAGEERQQRLWERAAGVRAALVAQTFLSAVSQLQNPVAADVRRLHSEGKGQKAEESQSLLTSAATALHEAPVAQAFQPAGSADFPVRRTRPLLAELGSPANRQTGMPALRSAIIPILLGDEAKAVQAAERLRERGLFIPAIRYPTVARGAARLRLTVTAAHTEDDIAELRAALRTLESEI